MKRIAIPAASAGFIFLGISLASLGSPSLDEKLPPMESTNTVKQQPPEQRGAYLVRIGNCMGCHTAQGGKPYAGGHSLDTPIGTFITPNITPDQDTGIGLWNEDDFWRALHEGKGRNGTALYPACPYTEYTKITREDSNAIFAYLRSLPPVQQRNPPSRIRFPFNLRPLIYVWRALYFEEGVYRPQTAKSEEWNRGAYLVQGLGHCNACHTARNPIGASRSESLGGGQIMGSNWYAPSLTSLQEASTSDWSIQEIAQLLTTGMSSRAATTGPMTDVVSQSLQYLTDDDALGMAVYLQSLPRTAPHSRGVAPELTEEVDEQLRQGGKIYETYCQDCHGSFGQGSPGTYPPLAENRSIILANAVNPIRSILYGGYAPVTKTQPRPYGMPPFSQILHDKEVALVLSYIRNAWGNRGSLVTTVQVDKSRKGAQ
jgi:mono/diheme cytochrome c family protein